LQGLTVLGWYLKSDTAHKKYLNNLFKYDFIRHYKTNFFKM